MEAACKSIGWGEGFILVNDNITQCIVKLNTMCSVYLPHCNHFSFDLKNLQDVCHQLPSPFILMGYFNGNHILRECEKVNNSEKQSEDLILKNDQIILNKSITYFHPASDTLSSMDLKEGNV